MEVKIKVEISYSYYDGGEWKKAMATVEIGDQLPMDFSAAKVNSIRNAAWEEFVKTHEAASCAVIGNCTLTVG